MSKFKFINKGAVKFTLELFICITIGYLFFPFAVYIFRSYLTCYTGCSAIRIVNSPWLYHNRTVAIRGYLKLKFEVHEGRRKREEGRRTHV